MIMRFRYMVKKIFLNIFFIFKLKSLSVLVTVVSSCKFFVSFFSEHCYFC